MHVQAGTRLKPRPCFGMNFQSLFLKCTSAMIMWRTGEFGGSIPTPATDTPPGTGTSYFQKKKI